MHKHLTSCWTEVHWLHLRFHPRPHPRHREAVLAPCIPHIPQQATCCSPHTRLPSRGRNQTNVLFRCRQRGHYYRGGRREQRCCHAGTLVHRQYPVSGIKLVKRANLRNRRLTNMNLSAFGFLYRYSSRVPWPQKGETRAIDGPISGHSQKPKYG